MRSRNHRILLTLVLTAFAAGLGALAGYWWGRMVTLGRCEMKLDQYAVRIRDSAETAAAEATATLATLNGSRDPYCSDAEIAHFRQLFFRSEYLKDGGHMQSGYLDCSATLGRVARPSDEYVPDFTRRDGTRVYRNLAPLRIGDHTVITVQSGDSYIVYSPYNLRVLESATMHFVVSERDMPSGETRRLLGELPGAKWSTLTTDGRTRSGETLYATRCSARYAACMTAFTSIAEALQANRSEFGSYIVLSSICGGLVGLIFSLIIRRSQDIEHQLRRAIRRNAITVAYQPIVDLRSGRVVAAEALARWTDEQDRVVPPTEFIKVAEDRGFMCELTRALVARVLCDFGDVLRSAPDFKISVNIAASDLSDPGFLPMLKQSLAEANVEPHSVAVEITEGYTARDRTAMEAIKRLHQIGHSVLIDDFGTGYSSLSYLQDLYADAIKIDRAFTAAIGTEAVTVSILPQILAMAEALKLDVIVEGIETELQARYFADFEQPILGQGWMFGFPVGRDELRSHLTTNWFMTQQHACPEPIGG